LSDVINISLMPEVKSAKSVSVVPYQDTIEGLSGDIFDVFVKPYFANHNRPLKLGDTFIARGGMRAAEFKVHAIECQMVNKETIDS
jgi:transitional endoplasmic reticulum ATPase